MYETEEACIMESEACVKGVRIFMKEKADGMEGNEGIGKTIPR